MEYHFLYRDSNQPESFLEKYIPGTYILEQGYTDASKLRGGPTGNTRYLILSNHAGKDLGEVNETAKQWGLILFEHSTKFKVLDVYKKPGCIQILLTTDENIDEASLITAARSDFDECVNLPPIEELTKQQWLDRVKPPLGLNDSGEPFLKNQ